MPDNRLLNELSQRLAALLPAAEAAREDMRTKIEQTLKHGLQDLDVMTREEFEAQAEALTRAQERVGELEARLTAMEQRLDALEPAAGQEPSANKEPSAKKEPSTRDEPTVGE